MSYAIGIDLGTTNCAVSVYRQGKSEALSLDGRNIMPSVVSFDNKGNARVGVTAKRRMMIAPEDTVASAKRFMGDRNKHFKVGGKSLTPSNIAAILLKEVVKNAAKALGEEIWDAVVTVPAYFNEAQREDTKRAAEEAGLNVLRLVPEPTAAAVAYGFDAGKDQTLLVYDLGGGTFDVSVLALKGNKFDVKGVSGDSKLGGDDIDEALMRWVNKRFKDDTGLDIMADKSRDGLKAQQRLKELTEGAKIELSESDTAVIEVADLYGHPLEMEISIEEFNDLIDPLLEKTMQCIDDVLRDLDMTPEDIDRVILVGGSTKNRRVKEVVAAKIKEPYKAQNVDQAVSQGAAIIAASLFLPDEDSLPIDISDTTPVSFGIGVARDEPNGSRNFYFRNLIPKNTSYPCRAGFLGYTGRPDQPSVIIRAYAGEDSDPDENRPLGELELTVSRKPEQVPIGAIFNLDSDMLIHFTAVELPLDEDIHGIIQHAQENDGELDLIAIDRLIERGSTRTKTVTIKAE